MTRYVLLAGLAGIAALSGCTEAEAPTDTNEAAVAAPAEEMAMTQPAPGTYEVTDAGGKVTMTTINADGTFTTMDGDKTLYAGTVNRVGDKDCFDPEGDEPAMCYTAGEPDADGAFVVTADDGTVETVRPVKQ